MKNKLTKSILAIALVLAMSVPTYAAPRCGTVRFAGGDWMYQILCRYTGRCGGTETQKPAETQKPVETQAAPTTATAYEQEVIRLVNAERAKAGLPALTEDAVLTRTARMKSQDMRDKGYFDHNSPTYGTPFQLMKSQGVAYRTAGENIAMGYATPAAVVNAWMNSSGHRANILNASYTRIGIGYVAGGNYWTQHFAG